MSRDPELKAKWTLLVNSLSERFSDGDLLDLDAIIYLVGLQELGKYHQKFQKDEKVNLMHVGICRVLEPYGFYAFDFVDDQGWPHYSVVKPLPPLKAGEQTLLMKEALVQYFQERDFFED